MEPLVDVATMHTKEESSQVGVRWRLKAYSLTIEVVDWSLGSEGLMISLVVMATLFLSALRPTHSVVSFLIVLQIAVSSPWPRSRHTLHSVTGARWSRPLCLGIPEVDPSLPPQILTRVRLSR